MGFFSKEKINETFLEKEKPKKYTILLVDDEEANLRSLSGLLENDYNILTATDADKGLKIINNHPNPESIQLIISDQRMPEKTGVEFLKETIHTIPETVRIILTGFSDIEAIIGAINDGKVYKFLTKPIEPEDFKVTVKRALETFELEKSNKKLVNDLKELNTSLEKKVEERTIELEETMSALKKTQNNLIQSEKMAGLGTLVAGVAHEINNPVNFVYGIAYNLSENIKKFKEFIFELAEEETDSELIKLFDSHFQRIDTNIQDITDGSRRIQTIVNDLRTFSHLDESEIKAVDISEGILSTLRIIKARYHNEVDFEYVLNIKAIIDCWPDQLNQVFMNILVNACQAIQIRQNSDQANIAKGKLEIKTFIYKNNLAIEFKDNGCGMSEDTLKKVFEPFFTTKEVGSGVGMGMSISYGIIEKHNGEIVIDSEINRGTKVTILLPLNNKLISSENEIHKETEPPAPENSTGLFFRDKQAG